MEGSLIGCYCFVKESIVALWWWKLFPFRVVSSAVIKWLLVSKMLCAYHSAVLYYDSLKDLWQHVIIWKCFANKQLLFANFHSDESRLSTVAWFPLHKNVCRILCLYICLDELLDHIFINHVRQIWPRVLYKICCFFSNK